jgi:hypothetical protein
MSKQRFNGPVTTTYIDGRVETGKYYFWDEWTFAGFGVMCLMISAGISLIIFALRFKP